MSTNTPRHFIDIADLRRHELELILDMAAETREHLNHGVIEEPQILDGSVAAFVSTKKSFRTQGAIAMAAARLGGVSENFVESATLDESGKKSREPYAHMVRCLQEQGYPVIFARLGAHDDIMEMVEAAKSASIVNALTDESHPTQAVADIEALRLAKPHGGRMKIVFSGDGNNVAVSLAEAAALLGYDFVHTGPDDSKYKIKPERWGPILETAQRNGGSAEYKTDPTEAVPDADMVYADVFASMGQKGEAVQRRADLAPWKVTEELMDRAGEKALFGHCLPAVSNEEADDSLFENPKRSIVFQIAGCRMDAMVAIMRHLQKQD